MSEFKREERYIVIKRKAIDERTEHHLRGAMALLAVPTVECVVVEHDWPEYEPVWRMIESRMTGDAAPQPMDESVAVVKRFHVDQWYAPDGVGGTKTSVEVLKDLPDGTKLYTHPVNVEELQQDYIDLHNKHEALNAEGIAIGSLSRETSSERIVLDPIGDPHIKDGMVVYTAPDALKAEVERLKAQLDVTQKDAERYRWFRENCCKGENLVIAQSDGFSLSSWSGDDPDRYIDAAIQEQQP
jgi:hypothetical protein